MVHTQRFTLKGSHSKVHTQGTSKVHTIVTSGSPVPKSSFTRHTKVHTLHQGSPQGSHQRFTLKGSHSKVHTQRFTLIGSHSKVHTQRFTLKGSHSKVHTQRFTLIGSHSKVHTQRFTLKGSHSKDEVLWVLGGNY
ncbi:putative uncharacterized protein FLJ46204 [Homarus americanus]|uniref:putative uncharacterized protein FLJ46204 n=1 Tax=Homarus americanus TaxID=6706 RepID=UPI001C48CDA5|nr:putative uncharacterized protein FLJ46204 [Homarus americanus]